MTGGLLERCDRIGCAIAQQAPDGDYTKVWCLALQDVLHAAEIPLGTDDCPQQVVEAFEPDSAEAQRVDAAVQETLNHVNRLVQDAAQSRGGES